LRRTEAGAAEDVAAETFLVAWRRLDAIPADALPWLYGVARKTLANHRRGARRRVALVARLSQALSRPIGSDAAGDAVARRSSIVAALGRLSERDREVLRLVAWEDLDRPRAARAAGCSERAFAVRLHRARRRLLKELAAGGHSTTEMLNSTANEVGKA
jgi:RNA polymerase sigma-70 factor (ECF subfamily)